MAGSPQWWIQPNSTTPRGSFRATKEEAAALREFEGFDSDSRALSLLWEDSDATWIGGAPFTKSEAAELDSRAQRALAQNDLLDSVYNTPGFAGSSLSDGPEQDLTIYGTAEFLRAASGDLAGYDASQLATAEVKFSLADLEVAAAAIDSLILEKRSVLDSGLAIIGRAIDYETNSVTVHVIPVRDSAFAPATQEQADELADLLGDVDAIGDVLVLKDLPNKQSLCNQSVCTPPSAGVGVGRSGYTNSCTLGFVVRRVDNGNFYITTAGHCFNVGQATTMGNSSPQLPLGTVSYSVDQHNGTGDFAAINIVDTVAANDAIRHLYAGVGYPITRVERQWQLSKDERYCMKGINASNCGKVISASAGVCFDTNRLRQCTFYQHDLVHGTFGGVSGDSGGGAVMRYHMHSAMGLVNGDGYYSHMDNLPIAHSQLRVYTSSIPQRDWMIPIYRHALNRNPDLSGLNYWANYIATSCWVGRGRVAITNVLTGPELTDPGISGLNWYTSGVQERVRRLYKGMLGRNPDTSGFNYWTNYVLSVSGQSNRIARFQQMVSHFAYAPEFTQRFDYGTQGDRPACSQ